MTEDRKFIGKYNICRKGLVRLDATGSIATYSIHADGGAPIDDATTSGRNGAKLDRTW
jgi:hypothetical protein